MAIVYVRESGALIEGAAVALFLAEQGIRCRAGAVSPIAGLSRASALDRASDGAILDAWAREIASENAFHGFESASIVRLSHENPDYDAIARAFEHEHHHDFAEPRILVLGHAVYVVRDPRGALIDIALEPGDRLSIPPGRGHWLTLLGDRTLVAVRLFRASEAWSAIPSGGGSGGTAIPREVLARAFGDEVALGACA